MEKNSEETQRYLKLKTIATLIITTGVIVSGIWTFFFVRTCALKDEQITLLEKQNTDHKESDSAFVAIKSLEQKIVPLTLAFPMDGFNGRVKLGTGIETPTEVTNLIIAAEDLRKNKKYDLAESKLDEIDKVYPSFPGATYFRFLIEKDKGNDKEAFLFAEKIIDSLPNDKRILDAYEFAVQKNIELENKKKAEDLCLRAIKLDPENKRWVDFFKAVFGYEPTLPESDK